jgi:type I restriction enzyme S subunit
MTLKNPKGSYEYVRHALQRKLSDLKQGSKGTNTKYLTMELFRRTFIQFPPVDRQQEFARSVRTAESLATVYGKSLAELDALFHSLQHRAFRGEL